MVLDEKKGKNFHVITQRKKTHDILSVASFMTFDRTAEMIYTNKNQCFVNIWTEMNVWKS